MRVLHRKLLRDIRDAAGLLLVVVAIIGIGTGSFVGLRTSYAILTASQADYYRQYRLADFWVDLKKAPLTAVDPIAAFSGVASLQTRVVFDVILDLRDEARPITGRLISTPTHGFAHTINGLHLLRGTGFTGRSDEEVILSDPFAEAHGLNPGDSIAMILNRKRQHFRVVGTAISPEYVYMVRGTGDLIPNPESFGVLYIPEQYAREAFDFDNACNQIVGRLVPGKQQQLPALFDRIERRLDPYGVIATTPRSLQASNRFLSDEIRGLGASAAIMPAIFLGVAALILNVLMTRLVERQRTVVGTLKALGHGNPAVVRHFLAFGVIVGLAGGLVGALIGNALATAMVEMYKGFFQFPSFLRHTYPGLLLTGVGISMVFAVGGSLKGARAALRLHPAEAMRQRPPERGGAIVLERLTWLWKRLGFRTQLALRNVFRNRGRTLTGVVSCALAAAIVFCSLALYDGMRYLIDFQFDHVMRSDVDLALRDETSRRSFYEARMLPAVRYVEPTFGLACQLRHGAHARRMGVIGLPRPHRLTVPVDADAQPIEIPLAGLVLTSKLAELLEVRVGDTLELTPIRGRRDTYDVPVAAVAKTYIGVGAYADLHYLSELVGEAAAINGLQMRVDPAHQADLFRAVKGLPNVQAITINAEARANLEDTFVRTSVVSLGLLILFAGMMAFGAILNASMVEISDRLREVSTLRVIGYDPSAVAAIFLRQNVIVCLLGMVAAIPLSYAMLHGAALGYDSELFRMPVIIHARSVIGAAALMSLFIIVSQVFVYRRIRRLDWLEGVKVKE